MSKIIKLTTIVVFLFVFSNSFAQDKTIDSLKIVLRNPKIHDTTKLDAISNVMDNNYSEYDKKYYYLNNLLGKLALKNYSKNNNSELHEKYTKWVATYYNVLGMESMHKTDSKKGILYINKSITFFKSIKDYDDMYHQVLVKGNFYSVMYEYKKAIALMFSALKYYEKDEKENLDQIAYALSSIAFVYASEEKFQKSIEYNLKAIANSDLVKDKPQYLKNEYNCSIFINIASSYLELKKYPEAVNYLNKALELSEKNNNTSTTSIILSKIGLAKMELSELDEAEVLFKKSLSLSTDEMAITHANLALGKLYYLKRDLAKAAIYADKGLVLSKKNNYLDLQEQAAALSFNVSQDMKDFKKALQMHMFHDKLIDSTKIEATKNEMTQQELKYNYEKKELHIKLNTEKKNAQKNNWLIALSATLLLLLLGSYFYYRNNKQKQAIATFEKNQIKQKLLITQMNPHFIFNSIDNIQSLIYNKQDKEAVNYLTKFSKLTRQILENSTENYISLAEEIEMIENYLIIQQLLHNNKFDFKIDVEKTIDVETILLPPMLTQPFIENAIKHGLNSKTENGKVDISFYLKDDKLFFNVSDNGTGFDASKKVENHKSLAMTITKERLINYTKNQDFIVQTDNIIDEDGNSIGAKVIFEIPYIYEK